MHTRFFTMLAVALLFLGAFFGALFYGFELHKGDHETGAYHTLFAKAYPTLRMRFVDPFDGGDAKASVKQLTKAERVEFLNYCHYKLGLAEPDPVACFEAYRVPFCARGNTALNCAPSSRAQQRAHNK